MEEKDHLYLYNQIKIKFAPQEGGITLISLTSKNVEELTARFFADANYAEYFSTLTGLEDSKMPYAILSLIANKPRLFYCCEMFAQDEQMSTGEIMEFIKNPFDKNVFDPSRSNTDFAHLASLLLRDPKPC